MANYLPEGMRIDLPANRRALSSLAALQEALEELEQRAAALGADAVVGIDVDYEVLGSGNGMLMVTVSGTAVRLG